MTNHNSIQTWVYILTTKYITKMSLIHKRSSVQTSVDTYLVAIRGGVTKLWSRGQTFIIFRNYTTNWLVREANYKNSQIF